MSKKKKKDRVKKPIDVSTKLVLRKETHYFRNVLNWYRKLMKEQGAVVFLFTYLTLMLMGAITFFPSQTITLLGVVCVILMLMIVEDVIIYNIYKILKRILLKWVKKEIEQEVPEKKKKKKKK